MTKRNKKGQFVKGNQTWLGKKLSLTHIFNIGRNNKRNLGQKLTQEQRNKISKALKGRKLSEEHKKKLIQSHLGKLGKDSSNWKGGNIKRICEFCGKEFFIALNRQDTARFCSRSCKQKSKTKEQSPNWKGGINGNLARRARKQNAEGSHTQGEWELLKRQYGYTCPCCGKSEPEIKLSEDHIIPLSKGGSNYIENIQPLCRSCNSKKHTKIIKY